MRRRLSMLLVLFVAALLASPPGLAQSRKKLIDFSGYRVPTTQFVRNNIRAMEQLPYDGVVIRTGPRADIFDAELRPADLAADQANLRATTFRRLTSNFLIVFVETDADWSWFNTGDMAVAERNWTLMLRTARAGGMKGILFDSEPYGFSPWTYDAARYGGRSFAAVEDRVRQQGRRFGAIAERELPGGEILSLFLMGLVRAEAEYFSGDLSKADYGLLRAFLEGLLLGSRTIRIIDGNEGSYYYTRAVQFDESRPWIRGADYLIRPEARAAYRERVKIAPAVYVDGVLDLWRSPRYFGHFLASREERRNLFRHNVYHGVRTSDEYVWVYNENPDVWRGVQPDGFAVLADAARDRQLAGEPLGLRLADAIARAQRDFDRRSLVEGEVTIDDRPVEGLYVDSGTAAGGEDVSCNFTSTTGYYNCYFRAGWSGSVRPRADGVTFSPQRRSYTNLRGSRSGQDFAGSWD